MRRLWLTILLAVSLASGGIASAWAAQACPYKSAPVKSHSCCPGGEKTETPTGDHHSKKATDCKIGQACRASVAVAPSLPMVATAPVIHDASLKVVTVTQHLPAVSFAFWRPPRTV